MEQYISFKNLVENFEVLPYPGRIYVAIQSSKRLEATEYWVLSSKELKEQELIETASGPIPEVLAKDNVIDYMSVGIFQDIIYNFLENNTTKSLFDIDAVKDAVNYYLNYDDFKY